EYLSTLTPAGIVQSYGNAFRSLRSTNPRRRRAALVFTALFLLPIGVVALGWTMVLLHSL
ncbi:MAG TPA: hypothetical protein VGP92_19720, partial [Acidimicrobiia bacterium]|nr:hypothetical protein [Acidimicrobiia bacterium]